VLRYVWIWWKCWWWSPSENWRVEFLTKSAKKPIPLLGKNKQLNTYSIISRIQYY
jgi:hypothetical protein